MSELNYFAALCFFWAAVGMVSRALMMALGKRWTQWELTHAYSEEKPRWIYAVGVIAVIIVIFTWVQVWVSDVPYSWIIAALVTLTLIKIFFLLFHYQQFREFVDTVLNDRRKRLRLNTGVISFSITFILMGVYLY